ncbi:PEPxxWA-CTERM sorting domain-containing protein [Phenylobacterium sp.]|uniref:PEPxxWA-CTERM sorting domain-containing protein n=1 Tax=Phenylobacterium sp. TaxID=1871053 RepID=UPI002FC74326
MARTLQTLALCACILTPSAAYADDIKAGVDASKMGHLDQDDLAVCKLPAGGTLACGPAAAVNSFVYLQKRFPLAYGGLLVPDGGEIAVGNTLGAAGYMATTPPSGTTWTNFYTGKTKYLQDKAPGVTRSTERNRPGADWLASYLKKGADVEILLGFSDAGFAGHYVTVTKISYDSAARTGTLSYIDPLDGQEHSAGLSSKATGAVVDISYSKPGDPKIYAGQIIRGASELPAKVPEPETWAMMVLGFGAIGAMIRGRRRLAIQTR